MDALPMLPDDDEGYEAAIAVMDADEATAQRKRWCAAFGCALDAYRAEAITSFDGLVALLTRNPETSSWMAEKRHADNDPELRRLWQKVQDAPPVIKVMPGELDRTTTAAEDRIIATGAEVYQRGGELVRPVVREVPATEGRTVLSAGLAGMNEFAIVDALCPLAEFQKYDARSEDWVRINPPAAVAKTLLSRRGFWKVRQVVGVITTPTMRPDGSLLTAPGYDAATRLHHVGDGMRLDPAVHNPTRADAERALATLNGLLAEFPFVSEVARSVALSALITPAIRGALTVAPMHAFRANTAGTGKSYLADVASAIATGRPCPVISAAPGDDVETEKRLVGLLVSGVPLLSLDNVNGELGGDLLCQAIERPLVQVRPLGKSDIVEIESRATLFATGNNLRVKGDMVRRTLVCDLDAKEERPELRVFQADPVRAVMDDRGRYVSAALTITRAYVQLGCPDILRPIASFEAWSGIVRSALVWIGCADPAASMEQAREDDPELSDLREVMAAWDRAFGGLSMTLRAAGGSCEHPELFDVLTRISRGRNGPDTVRMGHWFAKNKGRIVGTQRFEIAGMTNGIKTWTLANVRSRT